MSIKNRHSNVCLKLLIDKAIFYFIFHSSKNLKWKQNFHTKTLSNYLLLTMAVWWSCVSRSRGTREGEGALVSNLVSHRWYDVENLTVPGKFKFKFFRGTETKFFVKKIKEKCVTFCLILNQIKISFSRIIIVFQS